MRNKWLLSGTHEGGRYAYHWALPQRATAVTSAFPLPPLPLYLLFYLRNVGFQQPGMQKVG